MATDELPIGEWLFRGADGRSAGRLVRLGEQVWQVEIDGVRRSVVHNLWCDVMACIPMVVDPVGWTASGDRWDLAWTGMGWGHLWPSLEIPCAWACRSGPDARMVEVLSPDATSVVAPLIGVLEAGIVEVDVYRLSKSRYFGEGELVIVGDGWADFRSDVEEAREVIADRLGIPLPDIGVRDA